MGDMAKFEHGGDLYGLPDAIDFSASLNPLGMPSEAKAALAASIDAFEAYPDPYSRDLTGAIAQHENVSADCVVVTAGATDAFSRIVRVLQPTRMLLPAPCFSGYEAAVRSHNVAVVRHYLEREANFDVDEGFLDKIADGVDMLFLCNPNNPTGRAIDRAFVEQVCARAQACGATVVLDECFAELAGLPSLVDLVSTFPNLVVVNAFTKTYAMAGLRLGYCICEPDLAERLREAGDMWAVSTPAQVAGLAALSNESFVTRSQEFVREQRAVLSGALRSVGMKVVPSQANFLLFESDRPLYAALLSRGIVIRRCGNFEGLDDSWYRIAVRTESENTQLVEMLQEVCFK